MCDADDTDDGGDDDDTLTLSFVLLFPCSAAGVKAKFLKEIILGEADVAEIAPEFAFELLSHMKGGPSVEVLLDLALSGDDAVNKPAAEVLKTQVFLYEADTDRLEAAYKDGNAIAKDILESYAAAEFFTTARQVGYNPATLLGLTAVLGLVLVAEGLGLSRAAR